MVEQLGSRKVLVATRKRILHGSAEGGAERGSNDGRAHQSSSRAHKSERRRGAPSAFILPHSCHVSLFPFSMARSAHAAPEIAPFCRHMIGLEGKPALPPFNVASSHWFVHYIIDNCSSTGPQLPPFYRPSTVPIALTNAGASGQDPLC